jgi:hypothetical protein
VSGVDERGSARFRVAVPPELEAGAYANVLLAWNTAYEFTLDFAIVQQPKASDEVDAADEVRCRVVSRIRIPVTLVFDVIRALNEQMTRYEQRFGEIRPPGRGEEG